MANWCNNTVVFEGKPEAIKQIQKLFNAMAKKQEKENQGQLPAFVADDNGGYFFDICQDYDDTDTFQYETKWSPNIDVVKQIAERYHVNFTQDYEELGCLVFGRVTYENGVLTDVWLEAKDWDAFTADEQTGIYHFENKIYESDYAILEILLERKIAKLT